VTRSFVCAALLIFATPALVAAATEFHEPTGFGKAKFGMSVADVKKVNPKLEPTEAMRKLEGKGPQMLAIYELKDQSVGTLKPCQAEFRFFNDELYEVQFHCPDRVKIGEYLQKTYGEPTKTTEQAAFWMGKHSAVSLAPRTGAFGFSDLVRSQAMQSVLFTYINKKKQEQAAAGAGQPSGASPTPPQAPAAPAPE